MNLTDAIRYYGNRVNGDPRIKIDDFDSHMLTWLTQLHKIHHIIEDAEDDIKAAPSCADVRIIHAMALDDIKEVIAND